MTDYTNWEEALFDQSSPTWDSTLCHHGTKGQKWGRRRYQNEDGSLTPAGREHYGVGEERKSGGLKSFFSNKKKKVSQMTDEELKAAIERRKMEKEYRDSSPYKGILEKGVDLVKGAIESHNARKEAEAERKLKNKELDIRQREVKAREAEASAKLTEAEAKKLSANAEDNKWIYYTNTRKGRRDHMRQTKAERTKAKAEKLTAKAAIKTAQAAKRNARAFFGSGWQMRKTMKMINNSFSYAPDRKDAITSFFNANKSVMTTSINVLGNGKKK